MTAAQTLTSSAVCRASSLSARRASTWVAICLAVIPGSCPRWFLYTHIIAGRGHFRQVFVDSCTSCLFSRPGCRASSVLLGGLVLGQRPRCGGVAATVGVEV